jgi:ApaG protein
MYREITREIEIVVEPSYAPEQSQPARGQYFFIYTIRITNQSQTATQLLTRHWVITDGNGDVREVKGPGVVGEQPVIEPGASYEYSSYCPLPTPTGNMRGTYRMMDENGAQYDVKIPLFFLRESESIH